MNTGCKKPSEAEANGLSYVYHPSFEGSDGATDWTAPAGSADVDALDFMPDDVTRGLARRMHYAAWRASHAVNRRQAARWRRRYYELRNQIVVGNRRLVYKAVRRWSAAARMADDFVGECQVVLIRSVTAFNPWLEIRFSTYAYTCLMRALSRLSRRQAADRLAHSVSLDALPCNEPCCAASPDEPADPRLARLGELFDRTPALLTAREQLILSRRFHLGGESRPAETLEQLGHTLGLSKERVRQVQKGALRKLREALTSAVPVS